MPAKRSNKVNKSQKPAKAKVADLLALPTQEQDLTGPIFFWREYGNEYGYLSQWYNSPFTTEDKSIMFGTAEQ